MTAAANHIVVTPAAAPVASAARSCTSADRPGTNIWCSSSLAPNAVVSATAVRLVPALMPAHSAPATARRTTSPRPQYAAPCADLSLTPSGVGGLGIDDTRKIA